LIFVSDTDIKQTARRIVWEEISSTSDKLHSLRSLLQAFNTSSGYLDSSLASFIHQGTVRSVTGNKLDVTGRKWR
jgi:hypothetical protein